MVNKPHENEKENLCLPVQQALNYIYNPVNVPNSANTMPTRNV